MDFEQLLKQLEQTVSKLDDPATTLDEGIALFNQGVEISKKCLGLLNEAKGKVVLLKRELDSVKESDLPLDVE